MIDLGQDAASVAAVVLLVVLAIGVAAGRAKRRLTLLVAGLAAVLAAGFLVSMTTTPADAGRAAQLTALYAVALPLAAAFLAGWLCGRGSWLKRLVVVGAAAVLLAAFPYAEAGRATAEALFPAG